jgi:hypothetical protein
VQNDRSSLQDLPVAAIGSIEFSTDKEFDSGVALQLVKQPRERVQASWGNVEVQAAPGCPYAVFQFKGAISREDALAKGRAHAESALDMLSITGNVDLLLQETENEHIVWWQQSGTNALAYVTTATSNVRVGPITLEVKDKDGNVVPPAFVRPTHNDGFRFFRLAQTSEDLFDAYRNMYLAFECLLSSRYPKGKGKEKDWLTMSLASANADLDLARLVPKGTADPAATILAEIYDNARLPLFHAKVGAPYFAPAANLSEREATRAAFNTLTQLVLRMAEKWYQARRQGGGVFESFLRSGNRTAFAGSNFLFSDSANVLHPNDSMGMAHDSIRTGIPFPAVLEESYGGQTRQHLLGELQLTNLGRGPLHAIYVVNEKSPLLSSTPDTTIDLTGFNRLQVIIFLRNNNASQPKYLYSR